MVAPANAAEAALVTSLQVHAPSNLREAASWLRDGLASAPVCSPESQATLTAPANQLDLADVRGQEQAKRGPDHCRCRTA